MNVPDRYNYIGIFLTLRCNLNCFYCINKHSKLEKRTELFAHRWIDVLNRLKMNKDLPITLEGGEPSLHQGFYDIIKNVNSPVDILTNLRFDVDEFIGNVDPHWLNKGRAVSYKSIRISYHNQNQDELLSKAVRLQEAGFNVGIFSVNVPEKTVDNMVMTEKARLKNIYFFIKDFLGYRENRLFGYFRYPEAVDGNRKNITCRIKELLVAPDGLVYKCHRDLYANENNIGDITAENFEIKDIFRPCSNYGMCNPCDIKLKTNRFLEMGSCSVEVE